MAEVKREEILAGADIVFKFTEPAFDAAFGSVPLCTNCERPAIQTLRYRNRWGDGNVPVAHACPLHSADVMYDEMQKWLEKPGNHGLVINPDRMPPAAEVVVAAGSTEETEDEWMPSAGRWLNTIVGMAYWRPVRTVVLVDIPADLLHAFLTWEEWGPDSTVFEMQKFIREAIEKKGY